jgi:RNA polymerase sigma-70 factor, ECF subfamily
MTASVSDKKRARRGPHCVADVVHPFPFQGDDKTLVAGMMADHPGAFRAFYKRYVSVVYAVLLRTLGSDEELEILIHDVFCKAFQGIQRLKDVEQIKPWLAAIAVHTARDTIKQRKRSKWLCFLEPSKLPEPAQPHAGERSEKEAVETVYRILDKLSVDHRIAFTLRYMNEMELTEVADVCHVSLATIKRRLGRARKQFFALAKDQPSLKEWMPDE